MKKALFVANTDNFHKNFHLPYIKRLQENGYEVELVSAGNVDFTGIAQRHNIVFGRTPLKIQNIKAFLQLRKLLRNYYDIIYFSTPVVGAVGRMALIGKKRGRVIYSAHGYSFYNGNPEGNGKYIFIEKNLCRLTDCTFTMNREDYETVLKLRFPCKEIYNVDGVGIDTSVFYKCTQEEKSALREKYGYANDIFIMIYPAELTERKNQALLFAALKELLKKHTNVKLLLAGNGVMMDSYKGIASDMNLNEYVEFLGYRNDVKDLLKASDVLVASSTNEGLPINIIEGLASGLPVVATATRGQTDLIIDGYNGFLFGLNDSFAAASHICALIENHDLYEKMACNAIESVKKYDITNVIEQYDKVWGI